MRNERELGTILFPLTKLAHDHFFTKRIKNEKKLCDFLLSVLNDDEISDKIKALAMISMSILTEKSQSFLAYTHDNIDLAKLNRVRSKFALSDEEITAIYETKTRGDVPKTLEAKLAFRNSFNKFICEMVKYPETHQKLIQMGVIPLIKELVNDKNGEHIYGVHILKYLALSDRGSRELLKENFVPLVYSKITPRKSTKTAEWDLHGSLSIEYNYIKANDFLRSMVITYPNEMKSKYPDVYSNLEKISREGQSYESSKPLMKFFESMEKTLSTSVVGLAYGGLRQYIFNRRNPALAKSILTRGSLPVAGASGFACICYELYSRYYKDVFNDERLFIIQKMFLSSIAIGYFYVIGKYVPYTMVPFFFGRTGDKGNELDVKDVRSAIAAQRRADSWNKMREEEKQKEEEK